MIPYRAATSCSTQRIIYLQHKYNRKKLQPTPLMTIIIISSAVGTQFIPPPGLCQLKELEFLCGGRQPADCEFEHRSSASFQQNTALENLVVSLLGSQKPHIILLCQ